MVLAKDLFESIRFADSSKDKPYYPVGGKDICVLDNAPLLNFRPFKELDWLRFGFSTRLGGVSGGCFESMNLGFSNGDDRENVLENYKRACAFLGGDFKKLVLSDQVHGTKVQYVDESFAAGENIEKKLQGVDGLMTDVYGVILATSYADCVPLFFADVRHRAICSSHSGWKGTVEFMAYKTVGKMRERFDADPKDLICVIGPSICQECYEVGEDVIAGIKNAYPKEVWNDIFYLKDGAVGADGGRGAKYQLDLWAANCHQLLWAGLKKENIYVSGICTCCNKDILFSHRGARGRRGNMNGLMMIA